MENSYVKIDICEKLEYNNRYIIRRGGFMKNFMKKLKDMPVRKRLMISFICTVAVASIAGVLGAILLLAMDARYSTALVDNGFIQGDLGEYNANLNKGGAFARDIIMLDDADEVAFATESLAASDEKVDYYLKQFKEKLENDKERAILADIEEQYPKYIELRNKAIELGLNGSDDEALRIFRKEAVPYLQEVMSDSDELLSMNIQMGNEVSTELTVLSRIMIIVILIVIIVAVVIATTYANYTAKDFEKPIKKVQAATKKLAMGELDIDVQIDTKNELGEMAENFNIAVKELRTYIETIQCGLTEIGKGDFTVRPNVEFHGDFIALKEAIEHIITSLSSTLLQINEGSDQVALGAEQLAENAQNLAEGATSQAAAVEELTATIEDVAVSAENNAKKADEAYHSAEEFAKIAEQSSQEMKALTEAMERISNTSKEIESIIGEIEDIASQTNLLSLNASIEAARAGEAGKGFAVVADQIGKLASDSAQSAVNTNALIAKSLSEIVQGNEITLRTAEALQEVMEGIKLLADSSKETSVLSSEQANTMAQVQQGIEQIADVVQNNSASAQEASATSQELYAQSENLKALVEYFQLPS